jgi:hypothetical protein
LLAEVPLDGLLIPLEAASWVVSPARPRERSVQISSSTSSRSTRRTRTRSIIGTDDLEHLPATPLAAVTLIPVTIAVGERMIATWHTVTAPTTNTLLTIDILAITVVATGAETKVTAVRATEVRATEVRATEVREVMDSKANQTMEDLAISRYDGTLGGKVEMSSDCNTPNTRLA